MKRIFTAFSLTFSAVLCCAQQSVPVSCASFLNPQEKSDVTVPFHNYALSAEEVQGLTTAVALPAVQELDEAPAYDLNGMRATQGTRLQIQNGKKVLR